MTVDQVLDNIYPLPEASKLMIKELISEIKHPKGFILLNTNKIENRIYFVKKGIVRAYINSINHNITFWFGKEGDPVISMRSYVADQKGYEKIELLEDCELYEINTQHLQTLYNKDIHIANWGRKFAEKELIKTEERLISRQFRTATERYSDLLTTNANLMQRVQLGHIASYLGITQVSLSRIRAEIK
jgi:CRP-like cAMP-binding protein